MAQYGCLVGGLVIGGLVSVGLWVVIYYLNIIVRFGGEGEE